MERNVKMSIFDIYYLYNVRSLTYQASPHTAKPTQRWNGYYK